MSEEEKYGSLANAVVKQAVSDWRDLCKDIKKGKEKIKEYSFESLRAFFESGWCTVLCGNQNAKYILKKLEHERKEAIESAGREENHGTGN